MASTQPVDIPVTNIAYGFAHELDAGEPKVHEPDGNGLVALTRSANLLAGGSIVNGFTLVDENATTIDDIVAGPEHTCTVLLRVAQDGNAEGAPVELVHESTDVAAANRIYIPGGGSAYLTGNTFQMFRARVSVGGTMVWRWHLSNWTPDAGSSTYTPGNATHWAGTAPTNAQSGLDRLAAQVYALGSNTPIP
jgi:hypothetical protein